MGSQVSDININVILNIKNQTAVANLGTALGTLNTHLTQLSSALGGFTRPMVNAMGAITRMTNAMTMNAAVMAKVKQVTTSTADAEHKLAMQSAQLAAAQARASVAMTNQSGALARARTGWINLTNVQQKAAGTAANLARAEKTMSAATMSSLAVANTVKSKIRDIEKMVDPVFRAGFRMQMVGNDMKNLGMNILRTMGSIMSAWGDFEFAANRAAGAMDLFMASSQKGRLTLDQLYDTLISTSKELRLFPAQDVAKGMYFWQSTTGATVNTMSQLKATMDQLVPVMKAAALTQTDMEASIKGVYSILVQYDMGLAQTESVTQKLFLVTQKTAAEFPDLINSFKMVGPIAHANNISFDEMVKIFGKLADAGIRGTMAGRAIRQMLIQTIRPAAAAKKALDEVFQAAFGQSAEQVSYTGGQFIGLTAYINKLAEATRQYTPAERNALLARIATANELPVLTALVSEQVDALNGNSLAWKSSKFELQDAAATMAAAWTGLSKSWNGVMGAFQRGLDALKLNAGRSLAVALDPMLAKLGEMMDTLENWIRANPKVVQGLGKIAAGFAAFAVAAGSILIATGAMVALTASLAVAGPIIGRVVQVFTGFGGIVIGIAESIIRNWNELEKMLVEAGNNIDQAFGDAGKSGSGLKNVIKTIGDITRPVFDFITHSVVELVLQFSRLLKVLSSVGLTSGAIELLGKAIGIFMAAKIGLKALEFLRLASSIKQVTTITDQFGQQVEKNSKSMSRYGTQIGVVSRQKDQLGRRMKVENVQIASLSSGVQNAARKIGALGSASNIFKAVGVSSFNAVKGAATGLLASLGPIGIALLAITATAAVFNAAYQSNSGFARWVDSITDKFRDLKKELAEQRTAIGDWGDDLQNVTRRAAELAQRNKPVVVIPATVKFDMGPKLPWEAWTAKPVTIPAHLDTTDLDRETKAATDLIQNWIKRISGDLNLGLDMDSASRSVVQWAALFKGNVSQAMVYLQEFWELSASGGQLTSDELDGLLVDINRFKTQVGDTPLTIQDLVNFTGSDYSTFDAQIQGLMDHISASMSTNTDMTTGIMKLTGPALTQAVHDLAALVAKGTPKMREAADTLMSGLSTATQDAWTQAKEDVANGVEVVASEFMNSVEAAFGGQDWAALSKKIADMGKGTDILTDLTNNILSTNVTDVLNSSFGDLGREMVSTATKTITEQVSRMDNNVIQAAWATKFKQIFEAGSPAEQAGKQELYEFAKNLLRTTPASPAEIAANMHLFDNMALATTLKIKGELDKVDTKAIGLTAGQKLSYTLAYAARHTIDSIAGIATGVADGWLSALSTAFGKTDYKKAILDALKHRNSTTKNLFKSIKQLFDKAMTDAFNSGDTTATINAQAWAASINDSLSLAIDTLVSANDTTAIKNLHDGIMKWVSSGIPKGLSPSQLQVLNGLIAKVWTALGLADPPSFDETGKKVVKAVTDGIGNATPAGGVPIPVTPKAPAMTPQELAALMHVTYVPVTVKPVLDPKLAGMGGIASWFDSSTGGSSTKTIPMPPLAAPDTSAVTSTMAQMVTDSGTAGTNSSKAFVDGFKTIGADADAVALSARTLVTTTLTFSLYSVGYSDGTTYATGLNAALAIAVHNALVAAAKIRAALSTGSTGGGGSTSSNNAPHYNTGNRNNGLVANSFNTSLVTTRRNHHTVDINVKSPDGSVSRLKASQIADALIMSDIWSEMDHLSGVG